MTRYDSPPAQDHAVFVFSPDVQFRSMTVAALQRAGLLAIGGDNLRLAREYVEQFVAPLLVLAESPSVLARVSRDLRGRCPSVGIVAVSHYASVGQRVRVLSDGADVCLPGDLQIGELSAQLSALARRLGCRLADGVSPALPAWSLVDQGWSLLCPDGTRLGLSAAERVFMHALLSAPEASLRREAMQAMQAGKQVGRRMDMTVNRLRSKAASKGVALPVRAIRGWGYTFTGGT